MSALSLISGPRSLNLYAALLFFTLAGNAFAHGVTFKLQHAQPADSALNRNFVEPWANKIHDDSGGRINLLATPGNQADAAMDLFQLVQDRGADVVWLDLPQSADAFPRFSVFGSALAGATSAGSSQALWSWSDTNDLAFREFREMRILAASRHDAPLFHLREKPVSTLSDLKGLTIATPNADGQDFLTALGASPVVMPGSAMRKALTDASVDAILLSWSSLATLKLEDLVKVHVAAPPGAPWAYSELSVLLMNPDAYRSLADDLKQIIKDNSGGDISAWIGKVFDEEAIRSRKRAAERGDKIGNLPESDRPNWDEAANAAVNKRIKALDDLGLRGEKMISKVRALIGEYDPAR